MFINKKKSNLIEKIFFYEKRKENGSLLKNEGLKLGLELTNEIFADLISFEHYKNIKNKINNEYLDNYCKKKIFNQVNPIANQIVIINWMIDNDKKIDINTKFIIELSHFTSPNIHFFNCDDYNKLFLKYITSSHRDMIIFKNVNIFSRIIWALKKSNFFQSFFLYVLFKKITAFFINNFSLNNFESNSIAVTYGEGINLSKRSDLYWYIDSNIPSKKIFVYFDELSHFNSEKQNRLYLFEKYGIKSFYIHPIMFYKKNKININLNFFENLFSKENYFKLLLNEFTSRYIHYFNLFNKCKVKIHLDHFEKQTKPIIKQSALKNVGGCSFGKMRSYQDLIMGKLYYSFPNDVHFLWGNHSLKRIKSKIYNSCENFIPYIILNGYTHSHQRFEFNSNINDNLVNFLILDTTISANDTYIDQVAGIKYTNTIYLKFFELLIEFDFLYLTIKRKRNDYLAILDNSNPFFQKVLSTNRLNIIKDNNNMPASNISENIDYLFAITTEDIPSALLECTQRDTKSIIIDFTNLTFIEKELYELGENQIIFNDHNILFNKLRFFLKEKKFDDTFGNWNYMLNEIKSFDDFNGSKRVGEYIFNLISFIDQNYDVKHSLKKTNLLFKKKYGNNKVKELALNE